MFHALILLVAATAAALTASVKPAPVRAGATVLKPVQTWTDRSRTTDGRKHAPPNHVVSDEKAWKTLWKAWRPDEKIPPIDFNKSLVLVGTAPGPNRVFLTARLEDDGNVKLLVAATRIGGPGFGYQMIQVKRRGIKSVNGQPIGDPPEPAPGDYIKVEIKGTLKTGVFAIGGETTGTTITSGNVTWELELKNDRKAQAARRLNGKKVIVTGTLQKRKGVEIAERWIVTVTGLKAAE